MTKTLRDKRNGTVFSLDADRADHFLTINPNYEEVKDEPKPTPFSEPPAAPPKVLTAIAKTPKDVPPDAAA